MVELSREQLHVSVSDPVSNSMNFLNEVAGRFPDAISLAAGRPYDRDYRTTDIDGYLDTYRSYLAEQGHTEQQIRRLLMQYGRTNGQIHPLITRMLALDEDIDVPPESVMVTAGCQEAMVIALRGLFSQPSDVLLVPTPCYVGISGAARLLDIEVVGVPEDHDGLSPAAVASAARAVREAGKRPRALYVVPNFANPSGVSMDVADRHRLLEVAAAEDLLILEDNPYGLFGIDDRPRPNLKALDHDRRVVYLGSFAKSGFPGARIGFLVADQPVVDATGARRVLADELSTIKSMLTVNTSPVAQAVIGGMLVRAGCSLREFRRDTIEFYRRNLTTMLDALAAHFPGRSDGSSPVRWNVPDGGFFVVVEVPFRADEKLLEHSAREYGVLWTPMSFFYLDDGGHHALRLSCSWLSPDEITEGVRRVAALIRAQD